jgi:hypothetical protein
MSLEESCGLLARDEKQSRVEMPRLVAPSHDLIISGQA